MNDELRQANSRGFQLGQRHAALAEVIDKAGLWARSFCVVTTDVLPDDSMFVTRPLVPHADHLTELRNRLGEACADLARSFGGGVSAQDVSAMPTSQEPVIRSSTYTSGAHYVLVLQSTSAKCTTLQDLWRAEVATASLYLSVAGIRTDELERYASTSQALFDEASATIREAYAQAVAATYGRIWARASHADERRTLVAWMRALVDVGFSFDECVAQLRDVQVASPEAVSYCLRRGSEWLPEE